MIVNHTLKNFHRTEEVSSSDALCCLGQKFVVNHEGGPPVVVSQWWFFNGAGRIEGIEDPNYSLIGSGDDAESSDDEEPVEENVEEEVQEEVEEESADESADDTPDYASMKVAELKELLKAAGKPVSGKKDELIARLME